MGFRIPLTSLDTREGGVAGVLIEGSSATFYDGAGTAGRIYLEADPGGAGGSQFVVSGADRLAPTTPRTVFSEEEIGGGGGYEAVARLEGAPRGWECLIPPTPLIFPSPATFDTYDPAGTTWRPAKAWQTVDGVVHIDGMVVAKTAGAWGAGAVVARLPAVFPRPGRSQPFDQLGFNNRLWRCDLLGNGDLTYNAAISTDIAFTAGAYMSLELSYLPIV